MRPGARPPAPAPFRPATIPGAPPRCWRRRVPGRARCQGGELRSGGVRRASRAWARSLVRASSLEAARRVSRVFVSSDWSASFSAAHCIADCACRSSASASAACIRCRVWSSASPTASRSASRVRVMDASADLASSSACSSAGDAAGLPACSGSGPPQSPRWPPDTPPAWSPSRRSGTARISTARPARGTAGHVVVQMGVCHPCKRSRRPTRPRARSSVATGGRTWCRPGFRAARPGTGEGRGRWPRGSSRPGVVTVRLTGADSMISRSRVSVALGAAAPAAVAGRTSTGFKRDGHVQRSK